MEARETDINVDEGIPRVACRRWLEAYLGVSAPTLRKYRKLALECIPEFRAISEAIASDRQEPLGRPPYCQEQIQVLEIVHKLNKKYRSLDFVARILVNNRKKTA